MSCWSIQSIYLNVLNIANLGCCAHSILIMYKLLQINEAQSRTRGNQRETPGWAVCPVFNQSVVTQTFVVCKTLQLRTKKLVGCILK